MPAIDATVHFRVPVMSLDIEVACLKSLLSAFDISYNCDASTWVRSRSTLYSRQLARQYIHKEAVAQWLYGFVVHGIDPRLVPDMRTLLATNAIEAGPLDHVFVASSPRGSRDIFGTFLVFGHEPISFRLGAKYKGPSFTRVIVNNPLKGGGHRIHDIESVWAPNNIGLRSLATGRPEHLLAAQTENRMAAVNHAWAIAQFHDEDVAEVLSNWAVMLRRTGKPAETQADLATGRLFDLFGHSATHEDIAAAVAGHVGPNAQRTCVLPPEPLAPGFVADWASDLQAGYRAAARALYEKHGPPRIAHPDTKLVLQRR